MKQIGFVLMSILTMTELTAENLPSPPVAKVVPSPKGFVDRPTILLNVSCYPGGHDHADDPSGGTCVPIVDSRQRTMGRKRAPRGRYLHYQCAKVRHDLDAADRQFPSVSGRQQAIAINSLAMA